MVEKVVFDKKYDMATLWKKARAFSLVAFKMTYSEVQP